mgnify:CR=1 FL=1
MGIEPSSFNSHNSITTTTPPGSKILAKLHSFKVFFFYTIGIPKKQVTCSLLFSLFVFLSTLFSQVLLFCFKMLEPENVLNRQPQEEEEPTEKGVLFTEKGIAYKAISMTKRSSPVWKSFAVSKCGNHYCCISCRKLYSSGCAASTMTRHRCSSQTETDANQPKINEQRNKVCEV